MGFKEIKKSLIKAANKVIFSTKKNSPELLLGAGIVGVVATAILVGKETLKAEKVVKNYENKLTDIQQAKEIAEEQPEKYEYDTAIEKHDRMVLRVQTTGNLLKIYAPAVALGTVSIGCILAARNIMQKRYLGVVAAYNGLSEAFQLYRTRVIEDQGKIKDLEYRYGKKFKKETTEIINEDGTKEVVETYKPVDSIDPKDIAKDDSCVIFCDENDNWQENWELSMMFLRGQQNVATDMLHAKGHLFLNEVYDLLGMNDTPYGAVVGWLDDPTGVNDSYVDFGIMNMANPQKRIGDDYCIPLEFNHSGVIYDKI